MDQEQPPERAGRKYRSKKQRPCDLCRSRKIQCKIQSDQADCERCRRLDRHCTFVLGPLRRKYPPRDNVDGSTTGDANRAPGENGHNHLLSRQHDVPTFASASVLGHANADRDNNNTHLDIDMASFWPSSIDLQHPFGLSQAIPSQIMNWYTMASPLGGLQSGNDPLHSRPQVESDREHSNNSLSPTDILPPPTPQRHGHRFSTSSASGSPSSASKSADQVQAAGRMDTLSEERGFDDGLSPYPQIIENAADGGHILQPQEEQQGQLHSHRQSSDWPPGFSLESREGYSNQLIGLSSESDPYLLRQYYYDAYDTYPMFRLDFRKVVDDVKADHLNFPPPVDQTNPSTGSTPIQFVLSDEAIWQDDVKTAEKLFGGKGTEESDMETLNKLVPAGLGVRLLKLYMRFVHPRYPVLSLSDLKRIPSSDCTLSIPIGLRSAIYALSAPFTFLDDELSVSNGYLQVPTEELWAIAHRSFQRASRLSHISLLQLCMLLLQMPPQNFVVAEPPSFWALSCTALALAENLGLNLDPSGWRLPRKDIMLRRRLWWLLYIEHHWHALVSGRPPHYNDDNWFVSELTEDDFEPGSEEEQDLDVREAILQQMPICLAHCELSLIVADVLKEFYSVRANLQSHTLSSLLNRAQPLRARIESWRQSLPLLCTPVSQLSEEDFEMGASLRLSHLTLEILIFRALLRPLYHQSAPLSDKNREPISTIFENCYVCATAATEIVSALRAKHFANFWPHYVRFQLCYVSSFMLLNLAQSTSAETAVRNKALLRKWRDTLRIQGRAWPLARLAAMRLDAVFWKGLSSVVHGAGPDSPAVMLLKDQGSRRSKDG